MGIAVDPSSVMLQGQLARARGEDGLREAAEAFEAIFLRQLFDQMASSGFGERPGPAMAMVQDLFRAEAAATGARTGGVGIADLLMRQWGAKEGPSAGGQRSREVWSPVRAGGGRGRVPGGYGPAGLPDGARGTTQACGVLCAPYPMDRVIGVFEDMRPGGRVHRGLDLAGVGPNAGLGTPVRSMARERVVGIHRPEDDPERFGRPVAPGGTVVRRGQELPASAVVPGYGEVIFFTEDHGRARTGTMLVTEVVEGPLAGHRVRYMHLGAIHPSLRPGQVIEAGTEIGLMGGTAVQQSLPHVHLDVETPEGERLDLLPLLRPQAQRSGR